MLSYWQFLQDSGQVYQDKWLDYPSRVFRYNFVGSSLLGLTTTDLWKSLLTFKDWKKNRNTELQEEEAFCIQRSLLEIHRGQLFPRLGLFHRHDTLPMNGLTIYMQRDSLEFYSQRGTDGHL